ncbi:hypothetical protein KC19_5G155000 [Ceratodon purpureus]|uniref:Uncharacterized protein n=1 Tax=Ceratodon purpureus TaxID=3225 RepID=A0A8T0I4E1_CERPU|nr:hypothetical protein KC19_5G155000 [Ceratodon purpureus]
MAYLASKLVVLSPNLCLDRVRHPLDATPREISPQPVTSAANMDLREALQRSHQAQKRMDRERGSLGHGVFHHLLDLQHRNLILWNRDAAVV